jgi:MazG family protein
VADVLRNWEQIKQAEKGDEQGKEASLLGGVPKEMPALAHAGSIQRRVANVGFDWDDAGGALAKVAEEVGELHEATDEAERRAEFGDVLFALVSVGRKLGVDAEEALRLANQRFMQRFTRLEVAARQRGLALKELSPAELERLWRDVKHGQ